VLRTRSVIVGATAVVSLTMLTACGNRWDKVRQYDSPEASVRRVAYRNAVSTWRKAMNRLHADRRDTTDKYVDALNPDHVAIVTALREIPADQSRVIVLHHLVGLTVAEINHETGIPTGTVTTWLARGRRAMAKHLTDSEDLAMGRKHRDV
jgi:DNA-directed RNA polymerase specialized sigma24 family protein